MVELVVILQQRMRQGREGKSANKLKVDYHSHKQREKTLNWLIRP